MQFWSKELLGSGSNNKVYLNILTAPNNSLGYPRAEVAWVSKKPETTPPSNTPLLKSDSDSGAINSLDRTIIFLNEKVSLTTASLTLNYVGETTRTGCVFDVYTSGTNGTFGYVLQGSKVGEAFFPAFCDNPVNYTMYGIVQGTTLLVYNSSGTNTRRYENVFNGATAKSYLVTYKERSL